MSRAICRLDIVEIAQEQRSIRQCVIVIGLRMELGFNEGTSRPLSCVDFDVIGSR
jgi:hypothetical protein